ncbi:hypothetical protein R84981_002900 [Carnimonas sp. R-84981]|uniref:phage baseplate protein n=1 Tax=Carnimonas bestiolae TaxID=3402172 RepID=UPI003EDBC00A
MAITSIFTQSRPQIQGFTFDALLRETTEQRTNTTQYPLETGSYGFDNAVNMPLRLTMVVALSDNPLRSTIADFSSGNDLIGSAVGAVSGTALSVLPEALSSAAGVASRVVQSRDNQSATTRSGSALETIRAIQSERQFITVIGAKGVYYPVLITGTRQETNKENEQGLELVVEMQVFQFVDDIVSTTDRVPDQFKIGQAQQRKQGGSRSVRYD